MPEESTFPPHTDVMNRIHGAGRIPQVSVLMAAHNAEAYLNRAIQSITNQTLENFELILINDGSTDATQRIAEQLSENDKRIHIYNQDNAGLTKSLNKGLALCRAQLIARMDADDISRPSRLSAQVHFMKQNPGISALGCHILKIDANGRSVQVWRSPSRPDEAAWRLSLGCTLPHPGVMFRKSAVEQLGGYDPSKKSAEDYDLWCRMVRAGHSITNFPEILVDYRIHESQISTRKLDQQAETTELISLEQLQWVLGHEPDRQAVTDLKKLCGSGFKRCEIDEQRMINLNKLTLDFITSIRRRHSKDAHVQASRYTARKMAKAAFILGLKLDPGAMSFLISAGNIYSSKRKQK